MTVKTPGPSDDADLKRLATEASWLVSAFDSDWLDLSVGLFSDRQGGERIAARGEYQRWMQDARGWGLQALRLCERPAGVYRDQVRVDPVVRAAGQAVTKNVADDAPQAVHDVLQAYIAHAAEPDP